MRDMIFGTILVAGAGLGVFFWPTFEPVKTYPINRQDATNMIDRSNQMLKQVRFQGWHPYSYRAAPGYIEFIDRKSGSDAVCIAELEKEGPDAVSFEVSCPGAKPQGPLAAQRVEILKITLTEFVDATLTGRILDQSRVDAAFAAKIDLAGLGEDDKLSLKSQATFGPRGPTPGAANRRAARETYANHYNTTGEGGGDAGWSADGAFNALDD